jgi:hypothetical protein
MQARASLQALRDSVQQQQNDVAQHWMRQVYEFAPDCGEVQMLEAQLFMSNKQYEEATAAAGKILKVRCGAAGGPSLACSVLLAGAARPGPECSAAVARCWLVPLFASRPPPAWLRMWLLQLL